MKKIIILICLCITTQKITAQKITTSLAVKLGFGIGKARPNYDIGVNYALGLESYVNLSKKIIFNPGIDYKHMGYLSGSKTGKINFVTIDMPILLFGSERAMYFGVGPFIGLPVSDGTSQLKKDNGLVIKIGMLMGGISMNIQWNQGLKNMMPNSAPATSILKTYTLLGQLSIPLFK
jgi:hypothetical protein